MPRHGMKEIVSESWLFPKHSLAYKVFHIHQRIENSNTNILKRLEAVVFCVNFIILEKDYDYNLEVQRLVFDNFN